jgi:hypothetical protein
VIGQSGCYPCHHHRASYHKIRFMAPQHHVPRGGLLYSGARHGMDGHGNVWEMQCCSRECAASRCRWSNCCSPLLGLFTLQQHTAATLTAASHHLDRYSALPIDCQERLRGSSFKLHCFVPCPSWVILPGNLSQPTMPDAGARICHLLSLELFFFSSSFFPFLTLAPKSEHVAHFQW